MLSEQEELKLRAEKDSFHILCAYLLYERQEETEVRTAFASLIQERHVTFHDKENQITQFTECGNQLCINGLRLLQSARKPRIEMNDLSIQLMAPYNLVMHRDTQSRILIAFLEEMSTIKQPDSTLIKVQG